MASASRCFRVATVLALLPALGATALPAAAQAPLPAKKRVWFIARSRDLAGARALVAAVRAATLAPSDSAPR